MSLKKGINKICMPAPAKLNLFLGITGLRPDCFHELITVMAKLDLQDVVEVELVDEKDFIDCTCQISDDLNLVDNLAVKAVSAWRDFTGIQNGISISIQKRIPIKAGLGGGSSNAVSTLLALNKMMSNPLNFKELLNLATQIGSDCPCFLMNGILIARGRGEILSKASPSRLLELKQQSALLFKPTLGFSTAEIYKLFAKNNTYSNPDFLNEQLNSWESGSLPTIEFLMNDLEQVALEKYLFVPELFRVLSEKFKLNPHLSGSGSCCFCLEEKSYDWSEVKKTIFELWGEDSFVKTVGFV